MQTRLHADVVIIGAGLAGLVTALELLDSNKRVLLLDRDDPDRVGGLARESFGGINIVGSPVQRRMRIRDTPTLALSDWKSFAEFEAGDDWPRRWAENYVCSSKTDIYDWLRARSVGFFPVVHWVERGLYQPGNSVPRFHMVWGTGVALVESLLRHLNGHPGRSRLDMRFHHQVRSLERNGGSVSACVGVDTMTGEEFSVEAQQVVVAAGGICGNLERVRQHWHREWGTPPDVLLNGSHRFADGALHDEVARLGGLVTHLDLQWNYAAGVHHPFPNKPHHGLSLVPPRSALWMDYRGRRIGPMPLVTSYDTRFLVSEVCKQPRKYSWQILNRKIAVKELAVSGAEFNEGIRDRNWLKFLTTLLQGNKELVRTLTRECEDVVVADTVEELAARMNELNGDQEVDAVGMRSDIERYDEQIRIGGRFQTDEQLRRIAHVRKYAGDRLRTCKFQSLLDPKARPLMAIREFILCRKSLGGVQTDLDSRVLDGAGRPIDGLYAVGEAAGFGGGGIHGKRSLEGTFLGSCILTGQAAARSIMA